MPQSAAKKEYARLLPHSPSENVSSAIMYDIQMSPTAVIAVFCMHPFSPVSYAAVNKITSLCFLYHNNIVFYMHIINFFIIISLILLYFL